MPRRTAARLAAWEERGERYASSASNGDSSLLFPASPLITRAWIALGADVRADPSTWQWVDISDRIRWSDMVSTRVGRPDSSSQVSTKTATFRAANGDGWLSRKNPLSPWYGLLTINTPIRLAVDYGTGVSIRFEGYVNEFPNRWRDGLLDGTMVLRCSGILRRLQKNPLVQSPMRRSMSGVGPGDLLPSFYVPMEDGVNATYFASGLPTGTLNAYYSGAVTPAANSSIPGSSPLPSISAGGKIFGAVPYYATPVLTQQPFFQFAVKFDAKPSADYVFATFKLVGAGGGVVAVRLIVDVTSWAPQAAIRVETVGADGLMIDETFIAITGAFTLPNPDALFDRGISVLIGTWETAGAGYSFITQAVPVGDVFDGLSLITVASGASGRFASYEFANATTTESFAVGHAGFFPNTEGVALPGDNVFAQATYNAAAMGGWAGEMAHTRAIRVAREEGIPLFSVAASSALMGPQISGSALDIFRSCEAADVGAILYEHGFGLGFLSVAERMNRPGADITIDRSQIIGDLEPADDDQRKANQATIQRIGGVSATYDAGGGEGVYSAPGGNLSLAYDSQVLPAAAWTVAILNQDGDRWPAVDVALQRNPELIRQWISLPEAGGRLTLTRPPATMAPDDVHNVIEGWEERWNSRRWEASIGGSPAAVFDVGVYASTSTDSAGGRYSPDSFQLAEVVDSASTSWTANVSPVMSTSAAHYPQDAMIGGERVTITAISGATSPQTLTVQRSKNGVVKAHDPANAADRDITLIEAAYYAP